MSVSVVITLDTRRVKAKSGKYPDKLLVTCDSEPRRYQTIYDLTREEFNYLSANRITDGLKLIRDNLKQIKRNAEDAAIALDPFNYEEFEKDYILGNSLFHQRKSIKAKTVTASYDSYGLAYDRRFPIFKLPSPEPGTMLVTFLSYTHKLLGEGRIRSATNYQSTYTTFYKFRGNLKFTEINMPF